MRVVGEFGQGRGGWSVVQGMVSRGFWEKIEGNERDCGRTKSFGTWEEAVFASLFSLDSKDEHCGINRS